MRILRRWRRNERGKMGAPRKRGRMGWMAGKEHSSGPVIQAHSPIFFGFLLLPTLGQMPFTDGRQRPFSGYFARACWEPSSVQFEGISALINRMDQSKWPISTTRKMLASFSNFYKTFSMALQPSEVLPLNLSYQDLLSQHLKELHPTHDPSHVPNMREYVRVEIEPSQFSQEYAEQLVEKGYGAYPYFIWKEYGITKLYYLLLEAWSAHGPQSLDRWMALAQTLMDSVYAYDWPRSTFQATKQCPICLQTMVWTKTTVCGHVFHVHFLMNHVLWHSNTCPLCRYPRPVAEEDDD
ncbi:hypothetical protein NPIL_657731 [Nephila pilipes]|uniref:RING-type domain-containing protein n=1 Tax=Nephila pilipes TaxID=299642 RepID=A0A8X6NTR0_NEPPI|nr:hypothetical protein NPIL_657731 [Nephila pilipes]